MQFTIEKLIYGGDGLARIPAIGDERRGKTVFVPYVLPGEVVEASIVEERKGFTRASLLEVLTPSPARITPPCPHFGVCGGCQYQHSDYTAQLENKRQILQETVLRGAKFALQNIELHSGEPYGFRNRTRMKIEVEPEFALGYYRSGSHDLEPVRNCPISSPLINQAIALIWELAPEAASYPSLREIQFFANHDDSALLVELFIHHTTKPGVLAKFAKLMRERMPQIAGVAVFATGAMNGDLEDGNIEASRRLSRAGVPHIEGSPSLIYHVGRSKYRVSAGSFFQTNRFLVSKLVELVTNNRSGRAALDLFAGVGLFTLPMSRNFERVTSIEIAQDSYDDLAANATVPHIQAVHSTTENYLNAARGRWDYAVVDPPRAGLGERAAKSLAKLSIPRIAYVSCDPATLSRDLVTLLAFGYHVEEAHLVDLFPQTYHIETVLHLAR
ncbi:MAG: 23S rRNA (uracil(1939)-C(5))-methyltransferase RlmD [Acidobacteria bacterium]|nr:MAG: 23S rRNA (uracil(1939)-C(5))-methyltransferase RlmD [Acidobacteriota bacterium]